MTDGLSIKQGLSACCRDIWGLRTGRILATDCPARIDPAIPFSARQKASTPVDAERWCLVERKLSKTNTRASLAGESQQPLWGSTSYSGFNIPIGTDPPGLARCFSRTKADARSRLPAGVSLPLLATSLWYGLAGLRHVVEI